MKSVDKHNYDIAFKTNFKDKEAIRGLAKACGKSTSAYCREAVLKHQQLLKEYSKLKNAEANRILQASATLNEDTTMYPLAFFQ